MATHDHPGDQERPAGLIDWAGLPIDLDFAFSQVQRDKVYVQHLARERWRALRLPARDYLEYDPLDAEAG